MIKKKWFKIGFKEGFESALTKVWGICFPGHFYTLEDPKFAEMEVKEGFRNTLMKYIEDLRNPDIKFHSYIQSYFTHLDQNLDSHEKEYKLLEEKMEE